MCRCFDRVKSYNFCNITRQKMELCTPCETDVLYITRAMLLDAMLFKSTAVETTRFCVFLLKP